MSELDHPEIVAREYVTVDRLSQRRLDRTAWLRGEEAWLLALQAIAAMRPRRVLDAGCGTGEFTELIAAPEVVAVDSSAAAVAAARARGLDARVADIQRLPFADAEFDVVTCNWVLYHLPDRERGLAELARVLRPGGRFVGLSDARDHLAELWRPLGDPWRHAFGCERAPTELARHFARVERKDARAEATWETREALQAYLDAYRELLGPLKAPDGPYPFRAQRHNCILVAEKTRPPGLGEEPAPIVIAPASDQWPAEFRRVAGRLRAALGPLALRIDHIGSTAVPGLPAKDVIDVQVAVAALDTELLVDALRAAGYRQVEGIHQDHRPPGAEGEPGGWQKLFFRQTPPERPVNVHVRVDGAPNARYALLFRDYLRQHPRAASAYAEFKRRLAAFEPPLELSQYVDLKDPACDVILAAAEVWASWTGWRPATPDA
jgi:GrpB-like predicted nucleotidyltransferase (UPF0157 family)/SAM-dependent methyltransferase